jgi:type IV fimbrial biogenesis protein FimT
MLAHHQQQLLTAVENAMRQRGFSLVELMVAMAIFVLLMVAAMPSIGTWLDNTRIRNESDSIISGLQTARAEAVRRNENVSFWLVQLTDPATLANDCTLSDTSGSWIVSVSGPASHCADDATSTNASVNPEGIILGRPMGGDSGRVSVKAVNSSGDAGTYVTFNGFGRVADGNSITQVDLNGIGGATYRNLRVLVSTTGAVRLCDPAVSSSADPRKCPSAP